MSSSSADNDSGAEEDTINGDASPESHDDVVKNGNGNGNHPAGGRIVELLQEERGGASTTQQLGNGTNRFKAAQPVDDTSENSSSEALPYPPGSPAGSGLSIPDDSPSVQAGQSTMYI